MIRTQISLDEKEYLRVKKSAKKQGISMAEYIRRAIRQSLASSAEEERPWMRYAGMVAGDRDSSETIDDVVYGSKE